MRRKTGLYIALLIAALTLATLGFILKDAVSRPLSGVMIGVGAGLAGMSLAQLISWRIEKKDPAMARQAMIEQKDERNVIIRDKARATAANITQWLIIALAYMLILIDAPLWATLCAIAVYAAYHVITFVFIAMYQKRL